MQAGWIVDGPTACQSVLLTPSSNNYVLTLGCAATRCHLRLFVCLCTTPHATTQSPNPGVETIHPVGSLSDYEKEIMTAMQPELIASIEKGIKFVRDN